MFLSVPQRFLKLGLVVLAFSASGLRAAEPTQTAQGSGFAFQYPSASFKGFKVTREKRWTDADNGDDLPDPAAPVRVRFTLQQEVPAYARPNLGDAPTEATVVIIPLKDPSVPDFAKAYSDLTKCASEVRFMLRKGIRHAPPQTELPQWALIDAAQTIHAKAQVVDGPWCSGILYLSQEMQDDGPIENGRLNLVFQGLSKDGAFYIAITIPVANPLLTQAGPDMDHYTKAQVDAYYLAMEKRLDKARDDSFSPSLVELRAMIRSVKAVE